MRPWPDAATGFNPGRMNAAPTTIFDSGPCRGRIHAPLAGRSAGIQPGPH